MASYLLDTNIIIDVLNNKRGRHVLLLDLAKSGNLLACCPINITEVYAGLRAKEEIATERFFDSLEYYPITPESARLAGWLKNDHARKGISLNLGDVIIAAVAIHNHLTLITDNIKDFPMKELSLHPLPNN